MTASIQRRKYRTSVVALGLVALLSLLTISIRPIALEVLNVGPDPASLNIVGLPDGTHRCVLTSACDTMSISTNGADLIHTDFLIDLGGFVFPVLVTSITPRANPVDIATKPPPRATAA